MASFGFLNDKGKQLYGAIFPNGRIPLKSIFMCEGQFPDKPRDIYLVPVSALTEEQFLAIVDSISQTNKVSKQEVEAYFRKLGEIPIRVELLSGVGTDEIHYFF